MFLPERDGNFNLFLLGDDLVQLFLVQTHLANASTNISGR
jgi:hypothetical protein